MPATHSAHNTKTSPRTLWWSYYGFLKEITTHLVLTSLHHSFAHGESLLQPNCPLLRASVHSFFYFLICNVKLALTAHHIHQRRILFFEFATFKDDTTPEYRINVNAPKLDGTTKTKNRQATHSQEAAKREQTLVSMLTFCVEQQRKLILASVPR